MTYNFRKLVVALLPLLAACGLQAINVTPTSYSFTIAPHAAYPDSSGTELIDGVDGSAPWPAANGAPWVGWHQQNPTIIFNFGSVVTINTVSIEFQGDSAGGIYRPQSVQIGSDSAVAVANILSPAVEYLDFNGSWTGSSLNVKMNYRNQWIFVDEVKFSRTAVPDTGSTALLLGAGLIGLAAIRRKVKQN